jgi:trehalose 6-phosphate synthase
MLRQAEPCDHNCRTREGSRTSLDTLNAWGRVIVLANRAPFTHERTRDGRVGLKRSASELVTAFEPLVAPCSEIWVAHGSGNADTAVADERSGLDVPPANPQYRLR